MEKKKKKIFLPCPRIATGGKWIVRTVFAWAGWNIPGIFRHLILTNSSLHILIPIMMRIHVNIIIIIIIHIVIII